MNYSILKHVPFLLLLLLATAPPSRAQPFNIAGQPTPLSAAAGEVALFRVTVTGAVAVAYHWFKDGSPLADTDRISGTHAARLSLCPVTAGDAGQYHVQVTDGTNQIDSEAARLFVNVVLPVFTNAPSERNIASGGDAVFATGATGTPTIVYGWQRDGATVTNGGRFSGADTPTLTIAGALAEDTGWYALTASNADGLVTSEPARLRVHTASSLAGAAGFDEGAWTTGGSAVWLAQTGVTRDGNALSHEPIGDYGLTYLETTVYGPGELEFYWKVSSEGADHLSFLVDGNPWAIISLEVDWTRRTFHVGSGPHVLRWQYRKDGSIAVGADRGYVDQIMFTPTPHVNLATALNTPPLPLTTYGYDRWFGQTLTNLDGASAARSGYIPDNQSSTVETTVSGPGWIAFAWKVSSEGADPLRFLVDENSWDAIAGEVDWTHRTFHIPWGVHTLSWRYQKDGSIARGSDAAWLDEVSYTPVGLFDLAQAADWNGTSWTSGGAAPWFGQDENSADGADAMQSTPIGDNQSAWVDTAVTGPGTLVFQWKVSSEGGPDPLRFLVDSNEWNRIAGEVDWTAVTNVIRPGAHQLRWQYQKDGSIARGLDAGFVDQVSFVLAPPLPAAVNAPSLTWTTGGDTPWFAEAVTTHDGVAAARSGDLSHNQASVLQISLNGPGDGSFFWKVSSEGADRLFFLMDDSEQAQISGEVDWTEQPFSVPAGLHTLTWRYQKDYSVSIGRDTAWLDQFNFAGTAIVVVNPVLNGTAFTLAVSSVTGKSYVLEYKNNLDDAGWIPLPAVPGTGLPLELTDPAASTVHRFYRVRIE